MEEVFIRAEIIKREQGAVLVWIKNGFGEPEIMTIYEAIIQQDKRDGALVKLGPLVAFFLALFVTGCASGPAPVRPVLGQSDPIIIQKEGVGQLVTIYPSGRWRWHRKPKEVVSELTRSISELVNAAQGEHVARVSCEEKLNTKPKIVSVPVKSEKVVPTKIDSIKIK